MVLMTPKQLGPRTRTPLAVAIPTELHAATRRLLRPVSAKPPLMTTATGTPAAPQSAMTPGTVAGGVTTIARSTGSGAASRLGIGWTTEDFAGRRMDRHDLAGKARLGRCQIAQKQGSGFAGRSPKLRRRRRGAG